MHPAALVTKSVTKLDCHACVQPFFASSKIFLELEVFWGFFFYSAPRQWSLRVQKYAEFQRLLSLRVLLFLHAEMEESSAVFTEGCAVCVQCTSLLPIRNSAAPAPKGM